MQNGKYSDKINKMYTLFSLGYDIEATLTGFSRRSKIRKEAIDSLNIKKGGTIFDICCGTGLNFEILEHHVGNEGKILGIDLTRKMLNIAKLRCEKKGWRNIILLNANILEFNSEKLADCAISTVAMGTIEKYVEAIDNVMNHLKKGGRFAIVDGKLSDRYPYKILNHLFDLFSKSGGFNYNKRDLVNYIKSKYKIVLYKEYGGGFCYTITFQKF